MEEKSIAWMMHSIWTQQSNSDSQTQQEFWPSHSTLWFFWSCIWAFHVKRIRQIGLRGPGPLWDLLQWLALRPRRWLCRVCRGAGWHGGQERWIVLQGPCWTSSCRHLEIREMKNKICRYPSLPFLECPFLGISEVEVSPSNLEWCFAHPPRQAYKILRHGWTGQGWPPTKPSSPVRDVTSLELNWGSWALDKSSWFWEVLLLLEPLPLSFLQIGGLRGLGWQNGRFWSFTQWDELDGKRAVCFMKTAWQR